MEDVELECDRPVLSALGEHLVCLHIESGRNLDLLHLLPCIRLEKLTLCDDAALKLSRPLTDTEMRQLLPKLKTSSDVCSASESHVCPLLSTHFKGRLRFPCFYYG